MSKICLFCDREKAKASIIAEDNLTYARWDGHPVSKGHILIIPKEHIESFFDLSNVQLQSILNLFKEAKKVADKKYSPDGYNIGVNDGAAAGRTIHHLHFHLIPRYDGDVENPRGGVRHIIPGKGDY